MDGSFRQYLDLFGMAGVDHRTVSGFDPAAHTHKGSFQGHGVKACLQKQLSRPPGQGNREIIAPVLTEIKVSVFAHRRYLGDAPFHHLKTADVVVLPSTDKNEAFGMVILEAGHLDKSMVVTDIEGSGTAWVAGQFGATVVAARDLGALTAGIHQVLSMPPQESRDVPSADGGPFNLATQSREIIDHYRSLGS